MYCSIGTGQASRHMGRKHIRWIKPSKLLPHGRHVVVADRDNARLIQAQEHDPVTIWFCRHNMDTPVTDSIRGSPKWLIQYSSTACRVATSTSECWPSHLSTATGY